MVDFHNFKGQNQGNQQGRIPINVRAALQLTDDTWERLLCALERLEYVTEYQNNYQVPQPVATRLDRHKDKGNVRESSQEVELEVQLQIQAFKYVVSPVRNEAESWLLTDFIEWMAGRQRKNIGREPLPIGEVDVYAIPVLKCLVGEKFSLQEIRDLPSTPQTEREMRDTVEQLGAASEMTDRIEEEFLQNPNKNATQHRHERGNFRDGMERIKAIAKELKEENWFARFAGEKRWQKK